MGPQMRDAELMELSLALNISPEDMPYEADMPAGRATLSRGFYGPITEALAAGPRRVGDLLGLPALEGKRDNPAELIGILVGLDMAETVLRAGAEPTEQALRFNRTTMNKLMRTENPGRAIAAASHALGTGAPCTLFDLHVLDRVRQGEGEDNIGEWVRLYAGNLDEEGQGKLREVFSRSLRMRLPILRASGVF
jgi:hypothetical protein